MAISCPTNPISLPRAHLASATPTTTRTLRATYLSETGICPPSALPHQLDLHHLPGHTIPWPLSIEVSTAKAQHFLMLCPADTHQLRVYAVRHFPPEFLSMHDTSAPRSEKGPYGSENPFQNHSPGVAPGYALCSHLLLPLQNNLSHRKYLLTHRSPSGGYKLHEKKVILPLITP